MYGLGLIKGLGITMKNLVIPSRQFNVYQYPNKRATPWDLAKINNSKPFTYIAKNPLTTIKSFVGLVNVEEKLPQHPNFRGEEFAWYDNRCTGCASCAKYCPLGIIKIVTGTSGVNSQEGQSYDLEVFDIDIGRCMFCGLCVEACPYDALHMGSGFEEAQYQRSNLVIDINKLKSAEKKPSTWFRPQLVNQGHDPISGDTADWRKVGRHEKPSQEDQSERWAKR
ncbi:MAG: 4Fe-4S binding protein [SAR202 cluster bacterium]|nr:4Fe-4S binding protein [SAR202 cluster bacterium]|tara:strand:- start:565 stop:1236 length:672 start_codon:yes stop_codon:yes gene_type:complete